ncbi:HAMP domain-containing sensor histidine kinase [Nocardioides terrisoli]|uniref:HAMP domain-containing sensor histidine kinase n=1 Tax=Nocardioides terrisoli TaxID=3388267 RepID=UPI00287B7825|nr:HAMP domain-containing sensor histidine kinase [Nocardioides marmorisolisilvae]
MASYWAGLHYRRSLASRVIALTTMAVGLAVTVVALAAYFTVRTQTLSTLDDSLLERATAAVQGQALEGLSAQVPSWMLGAADVKIQFLNPGSARPVRSLDTAEPIGIGPPEVAVALGHSRSSTRTVWAQGKHWRVVAVPSGHDQALVLAQSLEPTDRMLDRLGLVLLLFGLAGVIVAGMAGWTVARNGLRPVRRLTSVVEDIARTERLDPIPVEGSDEIARLSTAFNRMLVALSTSRTRQRELVADAGHELRTPLTSLRTNLDLLVQSEGTLPAGQRRELLDDVRAQIGEMTNLIGDLTELARDEPGAPSLETVELASIVNQAVARVRRRATSLTFDVRTEPWWLTGDAASLERAITNLLDNAAKWSPEGGTVRVHLDEGTLMVADGGPGIPGPDLPRVFDRFYRSSSARSMPGSGLGLAIVRTVAERHGGVVRAGTGPDGGAGFWFWVPGQSAPLDEE